MVYNIVYIHYKYLYRINFLFIMKPKYKHNKKPIVPTLLAKKLK